MLFEHTIGQKAKKPASEITLKPAESSTIYVFEIKIDYYT